MGNFDHYVYGNFDHYTYGNKVRGAGEACRRQGIAFLPMAVESFGDGRDKAGPASGKNAGISHPEERAHHDVKSLRYLSFDTHSVILRKSTVSYFESPLLDMLIFIAHSLLSKTS